MANIGAFDATAVTPSVSLDPVPPAEYKAMVIESTVEPTSAGNGHYAKLVWQILEGSHANRKVFQNINLDNPSAEAVKIGQSQLSAICHAVGKLRIQDTQELHNLPAIIKVKIRPASGNFAASNDVAGVKSASVAAPAASPPSQAQVPSSPAPQSPQPQQPVPQPQRPAASNNAPPWARR